MTWQSGFVGAGRGVARLGMAGPQLSPINDQPVPKPPVPLRPLPKPKPPPPPPKPKGK